MEFTEINAAYPIAGAIIAFGTAWLTIRKVSKDSEKTKKEHAAEILQQAKESFATKEKGLQAKIDANEARIEVLEKSVEKDLAHLRETYNGEIRNLGEKIENLREELRSQHMQMVALLSKMVDNSRE